jgi:hypothetical protein
MFIFTSKGRSSRPSRPALCPLRSNASLPPEALENYEATFYRNASTDSAIAYFNSSIPFPVTAETSYSLSFFFLQ